MCSSAGTRATVRPTGFHQNRGAGFPRPTRHSSWPPAVKFALFEPFVESQVLQRFEADATMKNVFPPRALPRNATVPYLSDGFFGHPTLSTWFTSEYKKSGKKLDMGKGYGSSGGIAVQKVVAQTAIAAFN